jgi:hypothetical protein
MVLISLNAWLTEFSDSLNIVSICCFDGACVVPLAPAEMTRSGSTFHPFWVILLINGWYFCILLFIVSCENLSFVYVNSINCMVRLSAGSVGGVLWYGSSRTHSKSGLNLA